MRMLGAMFDVSVFDRCFEADGYVVTAAVVLMKNRLAMMMAVERQYHQIQRYRS
jgi:hypothetical protein